MTTTMTTDEADGLDPGTRSILMAAGAGAVVFLLLGAYAKNHTPTNTPISTLGFSTLLQMKSWTATVAAGLAGVQIVTAASMWGKLPGVETTPEWVAPVHRWSGTVAFLFTLPAAYHCLWALGFQDYSTRVAVHSTMGCAFFGIFTAKMILLRSKRLPGWTLPAAGGLLAAVLAIIWMTSSYWFFTN